MEVLHEKAIGLQPIVELVIVASRISVFMPLKTVRGTIEAEEKLDLIEDIRLDKRGSEAAIILGVIDQQRRSRGSDGGQVGIVQINKKICGNLLDISSVAWALDF